MDSRSSDEVLQLNNYDKLYLLMSKWKLFRLFNPLCYACDVTSIEDLESRVKTNLDDLRSRIPSINDDLEKIERMIEDSKTVKFEDVLFDLEIQKNTYREELETAGVKIIPKGNISLQKKIALGRPYSGDVYKAQWTQQPNNKIDVVVRYDLGPDQRDKFIREAKIMTGLHHEYIMKFYGAVILGPYAHSVGLVVEVFRNGNLEEFTVRSFYHAWLYASQLSLALEYLEAKNLVHTSVIEPFVYISSKQKISLGGFMCCYHKEETDEAREPGHHNGLATVSGHQAHHLDDPSVKGMVAMFAHLVRSMYRYLNSHHSTGNKKLPSLCPSGIASLMNRCLASDVNNRPAFQEIVQVLAKEKPVTFCFTMDNSAAEPCELSYKKGEKIWLISQDASSYHGMWLGQKECGDKKDGVKKGGDIGFFESQKVVKVEDDDNQVPLEIRARGLDAELAYRDALLEGKVKVCRARLLIIGQDRAGKTSLKKSLLGLPFNPEEPSTEVVEVNPSKFDFSVEQVAEWKAVDDGDEQVRPEYRSIARLMAENMQKKKTEENQTLPEEEKSVHDEEVATEPTQLSDVPQPPIDRSSTSRTVEASSTFSEDLVDGFQEQPRKEPNITVPKELTPLVTECLRNQDTSSDESNTSETVIDIWDFAGQHLYYATHPLFFSHRAVYLLVHDMSRNLYNLAEPSFKLGGHSVPLKNTSNETNLDVILSWLVSLHSIRQPTMDQNFVETCKSKLRCLPPPVLVVGTHADQVSSRQMEEVESQIISSLKGKTYQEHVLGFYKVDNTQSSDSPGIKAIQARVQEILSSGLNSTSDFPVKWFKFEKTLKNLADEKLYLTLDEIRDLARRECFIEDDKQLETMLNYYHDLGLIVRFKDTVVLDTQWLINLFKKLITICPYREQDPVDRKLWEELENTGVLNIQLINKVFENSLRGGGSKSLQQSVLDMMETYGFLAKFYPHKESGVQPSDSCSIDIKYFVPAQLCMSLGDLWALAPEDSDPCPLVFAFCDGFVPHGLFPQLVSRLIARCRELECIKVPKLYCNGVHFFVGKRSEFDLVLLCSKRYIRLVLKCYGSAPSNTQQVTENSPPVKVRSLIEEELESLCKQWHWLGNVRYEVCVACLACQRSSVKCQRHKSASCTDHDCLHLLPVCCVEPNTLMTCPEQIGNHSRFTLTGLHKWYASNTLELEAKPPENGRKLARISDINILNLASEITCRKWKMIGRLLGLEGSLLDQIEINKSGDVLEQCYEMLNAWKRSQASDATCEQLVAALCHKLVMKNDLVQSFCYLETA